VRINKISIKRTNMPRKATVQKTQASKSTSESEGDVIDFADVDKSASDESDLDSKKKSKKTSTTKKTTKATKVVKPEDKPVKKQTKSSKKEVVEDKPSKWEPKWENVSDDEADAKVVAEDSDVVPGAEDPELDASVGADVAAPAAPKRGVKYTNSAINFNYADYTDLTEPVSNLNDKDLVKVLIVRAHNCGQRALGDVLKQTLRAMNLECDFPGTTSSVRDARPAPSKPYEKGPRSFSTSRGGGRGGYKGGQRSFGSHPAEGSGQYESYERDERTPPSTGRYVGVGRGGGARYNSRDY